MTSAIISTPNDWPDDVLSQENGCYMNTCASCARSYIGHKRSFVCYPCHIKAKEEYDALSPEDKAVEDKACIEAANKAVKDIWGKDPKGIDNGTSET